MSPSIMETRLSKICETTEFCNWYAKPDDGPQGYKKTVENSVPLDETTCAYIIHEIVEMIQSYYLHRAVAKLITSRLTENMNRGIYSNINDLKIFAQVMTNDLQRFSRDKHFRLLFGVHPAQPSDIEQRRRLQDLNYGFGDIINLPGTIAYVRINGFVPIHWVGVRNKLAGIMSSIATADGLLLDLRKTEVEIQLQWHCWRVTCWKNSHWSGCDLKIIRLVNRLKYRQLAYSKVYGSALQSP